MPNAYIVEAVRTPVGKKKGSIAGMHAADLGAHALNALVKRSGIDPLIWPRNAGSWPGYVFTGDPLNLPAGHFGLGHGGGAHAPDEYYVIEPKDSRIQGYDGAVRSHIDYLYELAAVS